MQDIKYPNSVITAKNKTKTLSMDAHLFVPDVKNDNETHMPLEMHAGYSRFTASILDKSSGNGNKHLTAAKGLEVIPMVNIPPKEIKYLLDKTRDVMLVSMMQQMNQQGKKESTSASSPAYTVRISAGKLKGKTPAEAILESEDNVKLLENQIDFLKKNLSKYPRNQSQINAIREALELNDAGELKKDSVEASAPMYITLAEVTNKPLVRIKDENGNVLVTNYSLTYDSSSNSPFCFTIKNYFAPLKIQEDKTFRVSGAEATQNTEVHMNLSEKDWDIMIHSLNDCLEQFESIYARQQHNLAKKYSYKPE